MKRFNYFLVLIAVVSSMSVAAQVPADTVLMPADTIIMYQRDSAIIPATSSTVLFFQENEKIPAAMQVKTYIVTRAKKTVKLSVFLKPGGSMESPDHVLADLDNDGRKELLVYNFTGGAHCCDEIWIFKYIAPNKYQHTAQLFAGNTAILPGNIFEYDFHENFGYFFTCFACGYADESDEAPIPITSVKLKYNKGKLSVIPGDAELKSIINDNLAKLGERPYQKPDADFNQDEGQRKEVAINLAVYYYSFGKNMPETQKLFNKYYKFPDAKTVWAAFTKQLQYIRTANDF